MAGSGIAAFPDRVLPNWRSEEGVDAIIRLHLAAPYLSPPGGVGSSIADGCPWGHPLAEPLQCLLGLLPLFDLLAPQPSLVLLAAGEHRGLLVRPLVRKCRQKGRDVVWRLLSHLFECGRLPRLGLDGILWQRVSESVLRLVLHVVLQVIKVHPELLQDQEHVTNVGVCAASKLCIGVGSGGNLGDVPHYDLRQHVKGRLLRRLKPSSVCYLGCSTASNGPGKVLHGRRPQGGKWVGGQSPLRHPAESFSGN
mmetsp:Transcript_14789/g.41627  ORF Transcript_14789/g.41627 Transcript_14789/m.41627 type:complete len:252 (-) Transcript_14789:109-864(-)